jgi:hypothetical protein
VLVDQVQGSTTREDPGGDAGGGPLERGSWGYNAARARCSNPPL